MSSSSSPLLLTSGNAGAPKGSAGFDSFSKLRMYSCCSSNMISSGTLVSACGSGVDMLAEAPGGEVYVLISGQSGSRSESG